MPDSLDDFPTPPWATRALLKHVIGDVWSNYVCWEPAAGRGIMSSVLREYFKSVWASDVHDYNGESLDSIGSFVGSGADVARSPASWGFAPDWIITNPPFRLGEEFVRRALLEATVGVAMLCRTAFIESAARYPLFGSAFAVLAPFAGRVAMVKGRWQPDASTATSYAWFVWRRNHRGAAEVRIIHPEARNRLTHDDDADRFA